MTRVIFAEFPDQALAERVPERPDSPRELLRFPVVTVGGWLSRVAYHASKQDRIRELVAYVETELTAVEDDPEQSPTLLERPLQAVVDVVGINERVAQGPNSEEYGRLQVLKT